MKSFRLFPWAVAACGLIALALPLSSGAAGPPADSLVKGSGQAVYYLASDGRRYVFPDQKTYHSWFVGFSGIVTISDGELASLPLGGNVVYRPGIRMVKIVSDPKVYAVSPGGVLRWVQTETVAELLYGPKWNQMIDDVSDAFFVNYSIGDPILYAGDFVPADQADAALTINANQKIPAGPAARESDTQPGNDYANWADFAFSNINEIRAENGVAPLLRNALLDQIAFYHSKDMARNIGEMSHDGSRGESSSDRIKQGQVPHLDGEAGQMLVLPRPENIGWSGENVGMRDLDSFSGAAAAIVHQHQWFMDEPDGEYNHRTTMLSSMAPFSEVGIGLYLDDQNRLWITEDYISR